MIEIVLLIGILFGFRLLGVSTGSWLARRVHHVTVGLPRTLRSLQSESVDRVLSFAEIVLTCAAQAKALLESDLV